MTVTYTAEVATVRGLGCFLKLLIRLFGQIVEYCREYGSLIPLSFVLGFYVSIVMARWWNQYVTIPFPDSLAVFVSATVHGQDERGRVMRRTIMRYVCLSITMTFVMISPRVKKRFPTLEHFVEAGLLQQSELEVLADLEKKFPNYAKQWLPVVWGSSIVTRARKEGRIRDDFAVKTIIDELNKIRGKCGLLLGYDHISVPLVYTQVVTLAVYSYFLTNIMGHQWVEGGKYDFDLYFPIFTTLQFFFYVGWLKVAESLINPFGDDDDDFEVNWMVDRNLQVSYLIVDEMHHEHPELVKDQYWDEVFPQELPYTAAAEAFRDTHPLPSTANIALRPQEQEFVGPTSLKIDDMQAYADGGPITFSAKPRNISSVRSRGSQSSIGTSVPDSISRVNSVTNMLRRFFSREDSRTEPAKSETNELNNLIPGSESFGKGSVKRIADQVIEEVDEQTTITSQRSAKESRPTVMNLFGPPPASDPINVPQSHSFHNPMPEVYEPYPRISTSAPDTNGNIPDVMDRVSIGNSDTDEEDDEFSKLKKKRDEERLSRIKQNLSRSLSIKNDDTEALLNRRRSSILSTAPSTPLSPQPIFTMQA
ncbi:bestrophin-4 isoform X2 [Anoplophora glabripennis]|uniref:bestrophin-4 isoform X2 n=1 Tax=Anoplophora glabripennis TaxID=217634 RepID=UPI0008746D71|nr:bestrophin-4 isoform X2 [Anoplophora glabripennis]